VPAFIFSLPSSTAPALCLTQQQLWQRMAILMALMLAAALYGGDI